MRPANLLLAFGFGLALAGCAGAPSSTPATAAEHTAAGASSGYDDVYVEPEREDPAALDEEQRELERQLAEELARPEPRCERACELSSGICDLSGRICDIASRHTQDAELTTRCDDAGARCERARQRVAERCTCTAH